MKILRLLLAAVFLVDCSYLDERRLLRAAQLHQIEDIYPQLNLTVGWPIQLSVYGHWNDEVLKKYALQITEYLKAEKDKKTRIGLQQLVDKLRQMNYTVT